MARHPLDHDGDGKPGGSVVAKLGDTIIVHGPLGKRVGIVTKVEPGNGPFVVRVLSNQGEVPDYYLHNPMTEAEHDALPESDAAKSAAYWSFYRP